MKDPAWQQIDDGLRNLMDNETVLSLAELGARSQRLAHLERFIRTLKDRTNEEARGVKVSAVSPLFTAYFEGRNRVDENS